MYCTGYVYFEVTYQMPEPVEKVINEGPSNGELGCSDDCRSQSQPLNLSQQGCMILAGCHGQNSVPIHYSRLCQSSEPVEHQEIVRFQIEISNCQSGTRRGKGIEGRKLCSKVGWLADNEALPVCDGQD